MQRPCGICTYLRTQTPSPRSYDYYDVAWYNGDWMEAGIANSRLESGVQKLLSFIHWVRGSQGTVLPRSSGSPDLISQRFELRRPSLPHSFQQRACLGRNWHARIALNLGIGFIANWNSKGRGGVPRTTPWLYCHGRELHIRRGSVTKIEGCRTKSLFLGDDF